MTADVTAARQHIYERKRGATSEGQRVVSRQERDAALVILIDWLERTHPRQFRFGDACAELKGDYELTKEALKSLHGTGRVYLNNRVYYNAKGALRW